MNARRFCRKPAPATRSYADDRVAAGAGRVIVFLAELYETTSNIWIGSLARSLNSAFALTPRALLRATLVSGYTPPLLAVGTMPFRRRYTAI